MLSRICEPKLRHALTWSPAVALLGPRQVGKTTLAKKIAREFPQALYLDLESSADLARLSEPRMFFAANRARLLVLDEIQNLPEVFAELRGEIDADRRPGRFLILGSASIRLLRQSSESLAGRLAFIDMAPLLVREACRKFADVQTLWLRGGFPGSALAASDGVAWAWRDAFIRNLFTRDLPALGIGAAPDTLHRFWRMLAHRHGQLFNASSIAGALGVAAPTVTRYLDALTSALIVRRLEPYHANVGKRLVKSPKIYIRDSGLLHHLLNVREVNDLIGHPDAGASWEGFVLEQLCNQLPAGAAVSFYRTAAGAELDAVVELGRKKVGFEIKFSTSPKPAKGFWQAIEDVKPARAYVIAPVEAGFPLAENVEVLPVRRLSKVLERL